MGKTLLHIGFGGFIELDHVVAIVSPRSSPVQRVVRERRRAGAAHNMTNGRPSKAAIFTDDGEVTVAAITPEAIAGRVANLRAGKYAAAQAE